VHNTEDITCWVQSKSLRQLRLLSGAPASPVLFNESIEATSSMQVKVDSASRHSDLGDLGFVAADVGGSSDTM